MAGSDLVGRENELAAAADVLARAERCTARLVLSGEAGIGKSAVWERVLRDAAARGWAVLSCRPVESEARLAFGGLVDLLDRVPDDALTGLPEPQRAALEVALLRRRADDGAGGGAGDPRAVCLAALNVVRALAARTPVVLAVDDAQWLDEASARVLEYVLRRLAEERVAVVVAVRSDDDEQPPLGLAGQDDLAHLRLTGLSIGALHRLVRSAFGAPLPRPTLIRLQRTSGGNPFYALELARALARDGAATAPGLPLPAPRAFDELLADRLVALPAAARDALLYAAALAQPTVDLVRRAMPDPDEAEDALADAEDLGVVEVVAGAIRFTHPLLRSTAYSAAPAGRRRRAHRRLADVVADPETRALHLAFGAGAPDPGVAEALDGAALAARQRGAPETAARLWELAAGHATDPARGAALLVSAAQCLFFAGDAKRARDLFEAAVADLPDGPERVAALLELAVVVFYGDGPVEATALSDEALARAGDDPVLTATAYLRRSWFCQNDTALRYRNTRQALEAITGHEDAAPADLVACILVSSAYYRLLSGEGLATGDLCRAATLVSPTDQARDARMARSLLRVLTKYTDPVRGREEFARARRASLDRGDEAVAVHELVHLAELDVWLGDWDLAGREAAEAVDAAEQAGQRPWIAYALYTRALVDAHLGDDDAALRAAGEGLRIATELDDSWVTVHLMAVRGFVELSRQDPGAARAHLTAALEVCVTVGLADFPISSLYGDLVEVTAELGLVAEAEVLLAELERRRDRASRPWLAAVAARSAALVLMARGDLDGAHAALAVPTPLPMPFEQARTDLVRGRVLRRRKEKLAAREVLLAAKRVFDGLGAHHWSGRVDTELGRLGLRRGDEHDLTATELHIARLVAAGLSNREVAAAAYVSTKTVEAHLSRIYRKTGVTGRRELARLEFLRDPPD
ncbi:AAA family ATPase [Saccharothrix syringae]|uniref:Helix-turn-helix transcriptional regulator n=1 Tax=Saccharothrix syringae TaxID=103733 RepID=A0A5Q0H2E9_SACSY|nr:LuxR family transcriptional regulator [Saccharothrix syringae]QFZ20309.1 helix-turn-helix transcriptional regulator [Saccharothrix syringae]